MMSNKNVLAGPFIGEFGWELFCWQGFLRKRRQDYDSMTVICRPGHRILYEDFADEIIEIEIPNGDVNMWRGGIDVEPIVSYYKEHGDFTDFIPFNSYKTRWWLDPHRNQFQKFIPYGRESSSGIDILMHVRSVHHGGTSYRNWKASEARAYFDEVRKKGYSIGFVGKSDTVYDITNWPQGFVYDHRDIPLSKLVDIMSSSRVLIGSNSGPSHLACLCRLPVISWMEHADTAKRLSTYWNPFNVRTWTKAANKGCQQDRKPFTPSLDWMMNCTLAALDGDS